MSRDAITDVTFTLAKTEKIETKVKFRGKLIPKTEEVYTYEGDNGARLKFHAHPTRAWNWVIVPEGTNDLGRIAASVVIDKFCEVALARGDRTYEDAIKTLKI